MRHDDAIGLKDSFFTTLRRLCAPGQAPAAKYGRQPMPSRSKLNKHAPFAFLCGLASAQTSFTSRDKPALTYLFYWYNSTTGYHYGDGPLSQLTLNPPDSYVSHYSFSDPIFFSAN